MCGEQSRPRRKSSAQEIFRVGKFFRALKLSAPAGLSAQTGLSAQIPPSLRESPDPSSRTLDSTQHDSHWFPRAIPERLNTCNKTHSSLGQAICAAPAHPRTISLYSSSTQQYGRTNMRIYTQNTPNSAILHYHKNSGVHINLITINNASLSHNLNTSVHFKNARSTTTTPRVTTGGRH